MNRPQLCTLCGQPMPEIRLGIKLTPLKARLFDIIHRSGDDGITNRRIHKMLYYGEIEAPLISTVRQHVWQLNELIAGTDFHIKGIPGDHYSEWRLVKRENP